MLDFNRNITDLWIIRPRKICLYPHGIVQCPYVVSNKYYLSLFVDYVKENRLLYIVYVKLQSPVLARESTLQVR